MIVLDDAGGVVSDERVCIACADKGTRSRTSALQLQRPPRAPGRKPVPAEKRPAENDSEGDPLEEEPAAPVRRTRRTGAA